MRPTSRPGVQAAPTRGQQEAVTRATFPGLVTRAHSSVPKPWISSTQGTEAATPPTRSLPRATPPGSLLPGEAVGSSWSIMVSPELPHPPAQGWGQDELPAEPGALGQDSEPGQAGLPRGKRRPPAQPCPSLPAQQGDTRAGEAQLPLSSTSMQTSEGTRLLLLLLWAPRASHLTSRTLPQGLCLCHACF